MFTPSAYCRRRPLSDRVIIDTFCQTGPFRGQQGTHPQAGALRAVSSIQFCLSLYSPPARLCCRNLRTLGAQVKIEQGITFDSEVTYTVEIAVCLVVEGRGIPTATQVVR